MGACPSCGREVVEGAKFCSECGASLTGALPPAAAPPPVVAPPPAAPPSPMPTAPPPPPGWPRTSPGAPGTVATPWFPPPRTPPAWAYPYARPRTGLPTAAGVLLIISGVLAMIAWGILILIGSSVYEAVLPGASAVFCICGAIEFVFAIVMMAGGVMALDRRMWGLALAGSILGLFTIGFFFETSIMSLVALILLAVSRNEFR